MDHLQVLKHLLQGELQSKSAFLMPARECGQPHVNMCKQRVPVGNPVLNNHILHISAWV